MKHSKIPWLFSLVAFFLLNASMKKASPINTTLHTSWTRIDTMPNICNVVTPGEIDAMNIFNNGNITKSYPEPDPVEGFHACYYEFDATSHRYGALSVQLHRAASKKDAGDLFRQFKQDHHDLWGVSPEPILRLADSACITIHENCSDLCWECVLIVNQGVYVIWVNFKAPDNTKRDRLKAMGIKIVNLMYDRIPGLAPQYIRNKN